MKHSFLAVCRFAPLALVAACGAAKPQVEAAPVPVAVPLPEAVTAAAAEPPPPPPPPLVKRCADWLQEATSHRDALQAFGKPGPRQAPLTVTAVLHAWNEAVIALDRAAAEASLMFAVHPDKAVRDAAAQCEQQVDKLKTEIGLDRRIYDAIAQLDVQNEPADVKRLVALTLREFRLAGVDKDDATRERIKALQEQLVEAGQAFERAIPADTRKVALDPAQLKGLPQDWIAGHPAGPDGKVLVSTDTPDYLPMMQYAEDDAARKLLYVTYRQRAWPANRDNLAKILALRAELAQLTGFANWAQRITADKMIGTDKAAAQFIEKVSKVADRRMKAEYAELLQALRTVDPKATEVGDWQQQWLLGRVKKAKFDHDGQKLRPYLHYNKVKRGLMDLTSKLFGITYQANPSAEVWHSDVEAYDVLQDGKLHGRIYLDMHPRADKYKHAAQFIKVSGIAGRQVPEGVLVCNFPNPKAGNGLMEHKEVETFFHEFGHLLHHTLGGHQPWARFSGVVTEWDFVEAPSQIFEEWARDYTTLKAFATNDQGEEIPKVLVDKLNAADDFGRALWVRHQMFYAGLSLAMHDRDPKGIDQDALVSEVQGKYSPYKTVADTHMQASFGHLNGYSAIYYTYMWSLVIAKDMFSRFEKEGILNPAVAQRYRKHILEPGGSKDAADLVKDFLGRPYGFQSFEKWLNRKK
jgi:thimet oligopeptidase